MADIRDELRRQIRGGGERLDDQLRLGELVAAARAGEPRPSLSDLAADVGASVSTLYRAVRMVELCDRVGRCWSHLGPSHLRAVMHVPDALQDDLLRRAEAGGWTVRRLQREADLAVPPARDAGPGRPRRAPIVRTLHDLGRIVEQPDAFRGVDALRRLPARDLRAMLDALDRLVDECRGVQGALREVVADRSWSRSVA
jgi:hypothetical protein